MTPNQWVAEIEASRKREKEWRKEGQKILEIYAGKKPVIFNILYSNTETLMPSLYSAIPRPVVQRRFKDDDPIGKAAAEAGRRGLEFMIDTNVEGYETYDEAMKAAVLDSLLPGRGVTSVKYDAEIVGDDPAEITDITNDEGEPVDAPVQYKNGELVCAEARKWNRFLMGYATKWSAVPWIAFGEDIDKAEATRLFGKAVADELEYSSDVDDDKEDGKNKMDQDKGEAKTTPIWVIWNKSNREVIFLSEFYRDNFLKKPEPDPLGVTGFFPIPRPIQMVEKSCDLTPTALYHLYEEQAEELNNISRRIKRIVRAIKAKAIYDGELGSDIQNLVEADDNDMVPADKTSSLAAEKGLQNAIWFWPVDQLVIVLREMMTAREACKSVIWEIMGIADIMRGQSAASETLGAQQIKQQWGSLRLKRMQKEVMRYSRDLLRIMLEVAANKFSEETWAKMTGLPFLTQEQFAQAQAQLMGLQQQAKMMQSQMAMQPHPPAQPGQPPAPPPPNPQMQQIQQQMQAAQAELQKPQWKDILALLKDDVQRAYRIDIETNSTVEPEAAEDQQNIGELLNAIAQFLNGVGPLMQDGMMPFGVVQAMLLAIVKRFRFGTEIEDQIKAMQQPQPKPDPNQQKLQMDQQTHQQDMQMKQMDMQSKQQDNAQKQQADQAKLQIDQQRMALDAQKLQMEGDFAQQEHKFKMAELNAKMETAAVINASKIKVAQATAAAKEQAASRQSQGVQQ